MMPTVMSPAAHCSRSSSQIRAGLLRPVLWSETLMVKHLPDHIFAHPGCQIRRNDAHDRHIRQAGGRKDVINAGPERENHLEVGQFRQAEASGFQTTAYSMLGSVSPSGASLTGRSGAAFESSFTQTLGSQPVSESRYGPWLQDRS
jgi:uncharacterized ParB-like nuclease family protein